MKYRTILKVMGIYCVWAFACYLLILPFALLEVSRGTQVILGFLIGYLVAEICWLVWGLK